MEQIKNVGIYNYLKNINNKKQIQWLVTIKKIENCKIEIDKLYFNISNFDYLFKETKSIFHESTSNAFSIADFEIFWEEIFLKETQNILIKDYFLSDKFNESTVISSLEICFNFFVELYFNSEDIYNSREYHKPMKYDESKIAKRIYNIFKEACNEIIKFIKLFGYYFNENNFNNSSKNQKFQIIKSNYKNLIDSNNSINKDLKSLLIEISIISDLQELEKNLTLFYPYIEAEKENMEIILGKNITKNIFMLMNKFIRHKIKEKEWLSELNINQQEMKDIILWLKDIILFYFTCCSQTYPKTIIERISKSK